MLFNETIEYEVTVDVEAEPVTRDDLKRHLNMLFETDGDFDFGDDDVYLDSVIKHARESMERYTGLSFAPKTIVAVMRNELGEVELPFGPIVSIDSVKDKDGNTVTGEIIGRQFKRIASPISSYLEVAYTAGYETLPAPLFRAVLEEAAFRYAHRGDEENNGYCKAAMELAAPYKRTSWLA